MKMMMMSSGYWLLLMLQCYINVILAVYTYVVIDGSYWLVMVY